MARSRPTKKNVRIAIKALQDAKVSNYYTGVTPPVSLRTRKIPMCACGVVYEALIGPLPMKRVDDTKWADETFVYAGLQKLGFSSERIWRANDGYYASESNGKDDPKGTKQLGFKAAAEMLEKFYL